jgi:hypothetical protein
MFMTVPRYLPTPQNSYQGSWQFLDVYQVHRTVRNEELTVAHLVTKSPFSYGIRTFITDFVPVRYGCPSWARLIHSTHTQQYGISQRIFPIKSLKKSDFFMHSTYSTHVILSVKKLVTVHFVSSFHLGSRYYLQFLVFKRTEFMFSS